jgi:hypothetical protein
VTGDDLGEEVVGEPGVVARRRGVVVGLDASRRACGRTSRRRSPIRIRISVAGCREASSGTANASSSATYLMADLRPE